jgi:hypothetical protein
VLNYKEIFSGIQKPIVKSILSFDCKCELNDSFNASYFNNKNSFHYCDFGKWEAKITQTKGTLTTVNKRQKNKLMIQRKTPKTTKHT